MHSTYFELHVTPSHALDLFSDFIFSLGQEAIEEKNGMLIVRSEESLELVEWGVKAYAQKLGEALGHSIEVSTETFTQKNEDWIGKYQQSVQPIEVGNIYIHPSWVEAKPQLTNIVIDPALAFGSGHHQSTYGCLLMLQKYLPSHATLLDVGCGSGILSIAAAKLGAHVDLCDTDEQAVESALSNFALNDAGYEDSWTGSVGNRTKSYDVVVANIIADVLVMLAGDLMKAVNPGGLLILSGVLDKYEERIKTRFGALELQEMYVKDEWHTFIFKKGKANE